MMFSDITTFAQIDGFSAIDVPEGLVVFRDSQELHHLNHTAAAIYLLCARPITMGTICCILEEEFNGCAIRHAEVSLCLEELVRVGILEVTS